MAILEKLRFVRATKFAELVDIMGKMVVSAIEMARRLTALEKRVSDLEVPQRQPRSKFEATEDEVIRLRRIADLARRFRSHVTTIKSDGVRLGDELEGLLREQLGIPTTAEDEPGYTGPRCAGGEFHDEKLHPLTREDMQELFDQLGDDTAEDQLQKAEEGEPSTKSLEADYVDPELPQDTGVPLEDWMMDAVQRAVLERLKPFVGERLTEETVRAARAVAQAELWDMCARFGVTRKYRIDMATDKPVGQLTFQVIEG